MKIQQRKTPSLHGPSTAEHGCSIVRITHARGSGVAEKFRKYCSQATIKPSSSGEQAR